MNIRRWMSQPPVTTHAEFPVYLAHRKMIENGIRRLPVVTEDGQVIGIVSERDTRTVLLPDEITNADQDLVPQESPYVVKDVMTRTVIVVHPDDSLAQVVRVMHNNKISGVPVVERGRCIGVITIQDMLEVLSAALDRHLNEVNQEILDRASSLRKTTRASSSDYS